MGASFIGLADDATASESNPAGLTVLTQPEVSAHFRVSSFDNEAPNTVSGSGFATFNERLGSPSFFSVVYPWNRAAVSLYYQRAADYRNHSFFEGLPRAARPTTTRRRRSSGSRTPGCRRRSSWGPSSPWAARCASPA